MSIDVRDRLDELVGHSERLCHQIRIHFAMRPDIPKNTICVAVDYFAARHVLLAKRLRFLNELASEGRDGGRQRQTRLLAMM